MASDLAYPGPAALGTPHTETPPAATRPRAALVPIAGLVALIVTVGSLGWGFTQWSSARDWRHRSQTIEQTFSQLETRATSAETAGTNAERTALQLRTQLASSQNRVAQLANQQAYTRDLRVLLCDATQGLLSPQDRARICQ
jgi:uncharacterized protein HemX